MTERRSQWGLLIPWAVLPIALAIIALSEWLRHGRWSQRQAGGS